MKQEIKDKKLQLEQIKAELKTEFFGIDSVIDKIIQSIESWYIIPQALSNPIIVNLWGLTGVGKTHLVRRLVQKLERTTKFVEIQMDGYSNTGSFGKDSICSILQSSNINEGEPGILLLDEFQRYRTVDEEGKNEDIKRYQDIWMLLSDGKFSADVSLYLDIEREIANAEYYSEDEEEDEEDAILEEAGLKAKPAVATKGRSPKRKIIKKKKPIEKIKKYHISYYQAQLYKRLLHLSDSIPTIMSWEATKLSTMCREALDKRVSSEIDYSKLLIFVCGNLDEAFRMSTDLENCDTNADVFYHHSKRISVIDIKSCLKQRFKPEQIARLGNNHIIYPSLNKDAYKKIIYVTCQKYIDFVQTLGLTFKFAEGLYDEIYKNSVYPTQGARPVISSIHKFFSTIVPTTALWCMENEIKDVTITIDPENSKVIITKDDKVYSMPVELDIREQKAKNTIDFNTLVAVHEAGHALAYALLTRYAPMEIAINLSSFKGGYNLFPDEALNSKTEIMDYITIGLAGMAAEEMVFGAQNRSSGCSSDIDQATTSASNFYRTLGFGKTISKIASEMRAEDVNTDLGDTNKQIEKMMSECKVRARKLLEQNKIFLGAIVAILLEKNNITDEDFIELATKYQIVVSKKTADVSVKYSDLWSQFNKQNAK